MFQRFSMPSPALVIAFVALFVALVGSAYAVTLAQKNSVVSKSIKDGNVKTRDIADNAVTSTKILDSAVTTPKILDSAVTTPKIADSAVTTPKIADSAVTSTKIVDGAVGPTQLGAGAVKAAALGNVVTHVLDVPIATNTNDAGSVFCGPGERLITGGARSFSFRGLLVSSRPVKSDGNDAIEGEDDLFGWRAAINNTIETPDTPANPPATTLRIYAVCLQ